MNGGVLTIRTDTRVHANAPASMTGVLGAMTVSATLGGGVLIDATDVRWMAFDSGGGVVPAIGTSITQGGVSGYLLGVWSALNAAPTAVGAAMPSTGFLKFREVTGGPYSAGALTGITANASSADVAGWIEVVQRQAVANTIPRLGFYRTRGDWFYLDNTNGANLSAESISPTTGFKLKFRITCTTANASNALTYVRVTTDSTLVAQEAALYPQDYATITLTGMVAGSRVQLYDTTNTAELYNAVVAGTSLTYQTPYTADFNCRVRVMKQATTTAYEFVEFTESVTIDGVSRAITQVADAVYNTNAIDGGTVTGITIDDGALLVEFDTGTITWAQIYAYETYWLMTEEGIRDESRFMEAIDPANYLMTDFKIKNVSSPSEPLTITGGWGRDSVTGETVTLIDNTGGTIFSNPDLVIAYETSGGGGGASAAEVWSYSTRTLTSGGNSSVASAVRTELATELARVDVATSTRLADADYVAPDNAGIAAIPTNPLLDDDARLDNLDAAISTRLADADYIDPANSDVAAIKAKTDALTFTVAGQVDANVQSMNDAEVLGNGTSGNLWRGE